MPPKKTINRRRKRKTKVNTKDGKINIYIDNSRKTSARKPIIKDPKMQPFVNFPTFQPARQVITEVRPINYNSPDLKKTMDEYQKQFKTYLETSDKALKEMVEKYDDTLKKNTAPKQTAPEPEQKAGASEVFSDYQGNVIYEEPRSKHTRDDSNLKVGYHTWSRNEPKAVTLDNNVNEFKGNEIMTAQPINNKELVKEVFLTAGRDERQQLLGEAKKANLEDNRIEAFKRYKKLWEQINPDKEFNYTIDKYTTQNWTIQSNRLEKQLMEQEDKDKQEFIQVKSRSEKRKERKKKTEVEI